MGHSEPRGVVRDDHLAVACAVDVELERIRSVGKATLERGEGVLGQDP